MPLMCCHTEQKPLLQPLFRCRWRAGRAGAQLKWGWSKEAKRNLHACVDCGAHGLQALLLLRRRRRLLLHLLLHLLLLLLLL